MPEAIIAFLEAADVEEAIRLAISLGGDSDTLACIAGSIAEAYFGPLPTPLTTEVSQRLPAELLTVVETFTAKYGPGQP